MILLIEDNEAIRDGLKYTLEENKYEVECAKNISESKKLINNQELIILDVNLPNGNGFNLYEEYIKEKQIPTIFLTARDEESDIVKGLELAEDYITKPFKTSELLIRIKKILLRNKKENIMKIKNITFDIDSLKVEKNNKPIILSSLELNLLQHLIINKVSTLADLKNIKINIEKNTNETIICDMKWQIEAISNIIKNAIEHSKENQNIDITLESNKIYNEITITNYDAYIDEQDQKHIFERFYKAKNSKEESIGIGLALSKSIIEKNNGTIKVKSNKEKTQFIIKYNK